MHKLLKLLDGKERERKHVNAHTYVAWYVLLFAHLAHASFGLKLNCKYKQSKIIGAFHINNIYFKCQAYMTLFK